ncbi:single-stranded-DNA-specific exonuclease RecJ [Fuchsiella alkaliacetigena]|uniref:single-stranded-DNA-specific exonuclease RecJ n=1 Tax=Fuchsiella alkaliacetigena TaxID=957042 RepID=UPI00200ADDBF|nr:single-stranded-DNA-specific exonuclease RecJ [Fuchsiella alkaliacetigena]MCK8825226.1 single-stranded-DNA-specific exonuclease RecJ [Fuchsiella alkaliacetigena]
MIERQEWRFPNENIDSTQNLAANLGISSVFSQILVNRGLQTPKEVKHFLEVNLADLHSPFLLAGMEAAVIRIQAAVEAGERTVIYGDYDVDGIVSTALLIDYLGSLGLEVEAYIPNRLEEGYGLNKAAIEGLAQSGIELLITVDCGISDYQELKLAKELGIEVIITDHHEVPERLPPAEAIINPKYVDCTYPFTELCGAGVALKLIQALAIEDSTAVTMEVVQKYLDLVALATVADIVPLVDENRAIVKYGLEFLQTPRNLGIGALVEVTDLRDAEINTGHIGYILAPQLNAAGRIGNPELALQLLIADSKSEALQLATELKEFNEERQDIQAQILSEAEAMLATMDLESTEIIVLASRSWHSGVVGIVASKIVEKYYRPTVMIAIEEGIAKGSARSIKGFNIYQAIKNSRHLLANYGGHEQAAGLSIEAAHIAQFRQEISQYTKKYLTAQELLPTLKLDAKVKLKDLSRELVAELERLAPFGLRNPRPKLMVQEVAVDSLRLVGKNNKHLKLVVKDRSGTKVDCIGFEKAYFKEPLLKQQDSLDLACTLKINHWQGRSQLQLNLLDLHFRQLSTVDKLFLKAKSSLAKQSQPKSCLEQFHTKLIAATVQAAELEVGQELNLLRNTEEDEKSAVKVETLNGEELGYLNAELAEYLAPYLDTGYDYQVLVSAINKLRDQLNLFINRKPLQFSSQAEESIKVTADLTKDLNKVYKYLFGGLDLDLQSKFKKAIDDLAKEQSTLITAPLGIEAKSFYQSYAVLEALRTERTMLIILPLSVIVKEQFEFLAAKLTAQGLKVRQATADLNVAQQKELLNSLAAGEIDLLLITFQFWQHYQAEFSQFQEQIGLTVVDIISQLIASKDQWQRIIIDKLKTEQLLVILRGLNSSFAEQLSCSLQVEELIKLDFNQPNYKLLTGSSYGKKQQHLKDLLLSKEKSIIYVNRTQESVDLAGYLREELPEYSSQIALYNRLLKTEERSVVAKLFQRGELKAVVCDFVLSEGTIFSLAENIIFYQPPFNLLQFKSLLTGLGKETDKVEVQLLFNKVDIKAAQSWLSSFTPDKEVLANLYRVLKKASSEEGVINLNKSELTRKLAELEEGVTKATVRAGLKIFAQLGLLLKVDELNSSNFELQATPEEGFELMDSLKYKEGLLIRDLFAQFKCLIDDNQVQKLINY